MGESRHVTQERQTKIGCVVPGCDGVLYTLQPGERLGRAITAGLVKQVRHCMCEKCSHQHDIWVLVRESAA